MQNNDFAALQGGYIERVKAFVQKNYTSPPKACFVTYGCQQNVSDSERMKGIMEQMGYQIVEQPEGADFVLYNTCAVRGHAEDRVWGNLGAMKHYKRRKGNMILAICGCMAQQETVEGRVKKSYPYVDLLFGTKVQYRLPEFLYKRLNGSPRIFCREDSDNTIVENIPVHRDGSFKAWLPIMYGCNNFCTYCIVPYVRGRERSRAPQEILAEAKDLVAKGYKDITLLGQNVNSYGKGEAHGINFAKLLRMINDIEGDFRIRFMTSHPKDCTEELLVTMSECSKVARHLHLPLQSGSDRILKEMNRHYDLQSYMALIKKAKELMPDISLTSDIIVGFPGETYEDFTETLNAIKEVEYDSLFTFIYSPRGGTPAAELPDPVGKAEKSKWFQELLAVQEGISKRNEPKMVGKTVRVLCDDFGRNEGFMAGHTNGTAVVEFKGDKSLIGEYLTVKVENLTNVLLGTVLEEK